MDEAHPLSPLAEPELLASRDCWLAFSPITGLIEVGVSAEQAAARYAQALPERRPADFALERPQCPVRTSTPRLDFSFFHSLGHWAFGASCRSYYGGGWRHLSLWWDYEAGLLRPSNLWAALRCRLGRHEPSDSWRAVREQNLVLNAGGRCLHCSARTPRPWTGQVPSFF